MRRTLLLTAAALVAGAAWISSADAQDRARRAELSANQISDQVDAQTARIRADLRLTPDQEKNWAGFRDRDTRHRQSPDRPRKHNARG